MLLRGLEGTCHQHNSSALSTAAQTKAEKTYLVFIGHLLRCRIAERFHSDFVYLVFLQFNSPKPLFLPKAMFLSIGCYPQMASLTYSLCAT